MCDEKQQISSIDAVLGKPTFKYKFLRNFDSNHFIVLLVYSNPTGHAACMRNFDRVARVPGMVNC